MNFNIDRSHRLLMKLHLKDIIFPVGIKYFLWTLRQTILLKIGEFSTFFQLFLFIVLLWLSANNDKSHWTQKKFELIFEFIKSILTTFKLLFLKKNYRRFSLVFVTLLVAFWFSIKNNTSHSCFSNAEKFLSIYLLQLLAHAFLYLHTI